MASHPDPNPDSLPPVESDDVEQVSPSIPGPRRSDEERPDGDGDDRAP